MGVPAGLKTMATADRLPQIRKKEAPAKIILAEASFFVSRPMRPQTPDFSRASLSRALITLAARLDPPLRPAMVM